MTSFQMNGNGFSFSVFEPQRPPEPQVYRSSEGTGYPSCSRVLAKRPPNQNDANGYYKTLGLPPHATLKEIKSAIRRLLSKFHPDTEPDDITEEQRAERARMFARIKEIATVLTNSILKTNYDSIPRGRKLIDSEVLAEMEERGVTADDPGIQKFATMPDEGKAPPEDPDKPVRKFRERFWDYLATDHNELDLVNANEWYEAILAVAPIFRYEGILKVLLHDGKASAFKPMGGILLIPRGWEPSTALAFHLLLRHIGWPDVTTPRYAVPVPRAEEPLRCSPQGFNGGGGLLLMPPNTNTW